eukprot:TRINITY_DN4124_c4_g6_i1.p1 TRINITY_DN4124_c4_g6~~TRINITY_DN4124_c4_g6_i1.p1  ORF type:complete len:443 (+),score=159.77 TRINITY_DN4124_c4_g6_i1:57-1331(+)
MPVPIVLVAAKAGATGGFVATAVDFALQVVRKKLLAEESEPVDVEEMVQAFGIGAVVGNVGGTALYTMHIEGKLHHALSSIAAAELVYLPLHAALITGHGEALSANMPRVFGYTVFATAGGLLVADSFLHVHHLASAKVHYYTHVKEGLLGVGSSVVAAILFTFSNKFADMQRSKTILHRSTTVVTIHTLAVTAGQVLGTMTACDLALTTWLVKIPPWWFPSMIVAPAFFFCTALNIENGVQSVELNGRAEPTPEKRADAQRRISVMQTLPLGALPSGFVKGRAVDAVALLCVKVLAAACASTYIAYMQPPWYKYIRIERGELCRVSRQQAEQDWGIEWVDEGGFLRLGGVADDSPAQPLRKCVGRKLLAVNDVAVSTAAGWEEVSASTDHLNFDFSTLAEAREAAEGKAAEAQKDADTAPATS